MKYPNTKQKRLDDMTKFYIKELFYNIPIIPVEYSDEIESSLGEFLLERSRDYDPDEDELLFAYEYRWHRVNLWNDLGGVDIGEDSSWMDPLNHPEISIRINAKCADSARCLVSTLIHELIHYYCWYIGLEYHDHSKDFIKMCKKMDIPDNYSNHEWIEGRWKDTFDYTKIDKYIYMYIDNLKDDSTYAA